MAYIHIHSLRNTDTRHEIDINTLTLMLDIDIFKTPKTHSIKGVGAPELTTLTVTTSLTNKPTCIISTYTLSK